MLFRDVIQLLRIEEQPNDEDGSLVESTTSNRTVFANKKSVRGNEFYLASQQGFNLSCMFEVRSADYESETLLEYEAKQYEVVRTYDRGEFTELVCQAQK